MKTTTAPYTKSYMQHSPDTGADMRGEIDYIVCKEEYRHIVNEYKRYKKQNKDEITFKEWLKAEMDKPVEVREEDEE